MKANDLDLVCGVWVVCARGRAAERESVIEKREKIAIDWPAFVRVSARRTAGDIM